MTKIEKRYLANVCDAKDIVCNACRHHHGDMCSKCPIVNLIDNELRRLQTGDVNAVKELVDIFEADAIAKSIKERN